MSISLDKIVTQLNSKIVSGGQDAINTSRLADSVEALESRYSVPNLASLPPAVDNTGRFIYVEDIDAYRYSDGTQWTNDYDTTAGATNGQLWSWGSSGFAQLGDGTTTTRSSPVREFCSATDWCGVSAGVNHSAAVKSSGQLWSWGNNIFGHLGDGTTTDRCSPVREICSATDWCQASSGSRHTAAIKTSGQLWVWGCGLAIGAGAVTNHCSPVREFCSATDWCQVSAGTLATAAIKTSGQMWLWGNNTYGRLGDGTLVGRCSPVREFCSATDWCQVSVGNGNGFAVKTSGQLWGWGRNYCGRLGDGATIDRCSPVREFCSATDWCQVSSGGYHTAAVKTSGQIWSWGRSYTGSGVIGDGVNISRCSPVREFCSATDWCQVSVGSSHTVAVKTSGQIWGWGGNTFRTLGDGTNTTRCSPVREFCSATDWCQVSGGGDHTAAVKVIKGFNEP